MISAEIHLKELELSENGDSHHSKKHKLHRRRKDESDRRYKQSRSHSRPAGDDSEESSCVIFWTKCPLIRREWIIIRRLLRIARRSKLNDSFYLNAKKSSQSQSPIMLMQIKHKSYYVIKNDLVKTDF